MSAEQKVQLQSVDRLSSYGFVSSLLAVATRYYSNAKQSDSRIVKFTLDTAETIATPALSTLSALPERFPGTVQSVDSFTVSQLDRAERLSQKMWASGQTAYDSVRAYEQGAVDGVRSAVRSKQAYLDEAVVAPVSENVQALQSRAHQAVDSGMQTVETWVSTRSAEHQRRRARLAELFSSREKFQEAVLSYLPRVDTSLYKSYAESVRARVYSVSGAAKERVDKQTTFVASTLAAARAHITTQPRVVTERAAGLASAALSLNRRLLQQLRAAIASARDSRGKGGAYNAVLGLVPAPVYDMANCTLDKSDSAVAWIDSHVARYKAPTITVSRIEDDLDDEAAERAARDGPGFTWKHFTDAAEAAHERAEVARETQEDTVADAAHSAADMASEAAHQAHDEASEAAEEAAREVEDVDEGASELVSEGVSALEDELEQEDDEQEDDEQDDE